MSTDEPLAFLSYVRSDDETEDQRISQLRQRLAAEVQMQTGRPFPIFQDRNGIDWGENWRRRIEESVDKATFLIPVITPSFFNSAACIDELRQFCGRESQLKRDDLIMPIYYVSAPLLDD